MFPLASKSPIISGFLCHLCVKMLKNKGQSSAVILIQSQNEAQECQDFLQYLSKEEVSQGVDDTPHQQKKSLGEELSRYSISFQPFPPKPKPNNHKNQSKTHPKKIASPQVMSSQACQSIVTCIKTIFSQLPPLFSQSNSKYLFKWKAEESSLFTSHTQHLSEFDSLQNVYDWMKWPFSYRKFPTRSILSFKWLQHLKQCVIFSSSVRCCP